MIYEQISLYLNENGIKQTVLSKKAGLTKQSICSALNGKRKLSIDEYESICLALNLPWDYFFPKKKHKGRAPKAG